MAQTFEGAIKLPSNIDVQITSPLDTRLVVDSVESLTDGSIKYPYQGMIVAIKGTSELWILKTQGIEASHNSDNWGKVTGANGEIDPKALEEIKESISIVSDLVGSPDESDLSGLFKEIDDLKRIGVSSSLGYTIPMMTPAMAEKATNDPLIDFDEDSDPYILTDFDAGSLEGNVTNNTLTSINGTYLGIMMSAIRSLQAEVARLKNSFTYGINSYKDDRTAKSVLLGEYDNISTDEPLWSIDPGYLSEVEDSATFNTYLDKNHSFTKYGSGDIKVNVEGQLTFNNCKGEFSDGDSEGNNLTLYELTDSKLITYLVTDSPNITMTLVSLDDKTKTLNVDISNLLNGNTVNKYGFCIVISRKVVDSSTKVSKGFNYIYFSIINYETDEKLYEGYLTESNTLSDTRVDRDERYSIKSLLFDNLTLYRMKFYTKFEDFSEEVISSAPSENDYKYDAAHITIRSVETMSVLNDIKDQLLEDELVWCKKTGTLHIKSNGKIHLIGSKSVVDYDDSEDSEYNNNDNMTNKEILTALKNMGIVVNVNYKKDSSGKYTDEIDSVTDMSLAPISDFTFVNSDTGKEFTFTVDTEGNLVSKDNSEETIEEFIAKLKTNNKSGDYDATSYQAVRGFSSDYLYRKYYDSLGDEYDGAWDLASTVNFDGDAGKHSDRLRISSFYAPITTDKTHGCTHSFIELENTSDFDIPLTGIYLHFYNPAENNYTGKVHHLELNGVIKAGGTYLIRGAKHAEFDDASAFIKVKTFDQEWYEDKKLISFEQVAVETVKSGSTTTIKTDENGNVISKVKNAYRFCLTYGLSELSATTQLVQLNGSSVTIDGKSYAKKTYPNIILNPRFIDSCSFSTFKDVAAQTGTANNPWYINGSSGTGIVITENTMFRLTFALDPAKQAFNGFNVNDGSRARYNKAQDIQVLKLDKEFIGYPFGDESIKIERYTPKASFENRTVMTDKTQLDTEKPNMVTCSFGIDVYNTRCFNWISCGAFDEYIWIRKSGETKWTKFQSYTTVSKDNTENTTKTPRRKEYSTIVNNAAYARIIDRFPGNDVLFTSHKCVLVLPDAETVPVTYEYVVGRPDKDSQPDPEHTNDVYTFTIYPRTYEGRTYQITDQQGFHWMEYQVWAAAATHLNEVISDDMSSSEDENIFPILLNTGDMTQSGARINEWLDYYNAGKKLFNHLEQMNVVGNNDLCPTNPNDLGTGNDPDKSNSRFFHYFYCFDVKDTDRYNYYLASTESEDEGVAEKFSGESLIVKAHTGSYIDANGNEQSVDISENRYIPSFYYFKTKGVMYVMVNSEIPYDGCAGWFGLCSTNKRVVNIYTGIETIKNGVYDETCKDYFTPLYETMYAWLNDNSTNGKKKIVVAMHEMPFTVITHESLSNSNTDYLPSTRNYPLNKDARVGSNVNQIAKNENRGIYWCSRLLEYFGCKLVIGGHKHTYALSYPIKEKYSWNYDGTTNDSNDNIKPMFATLADEAGETPLYEISWSLSLDPGDSELETDGDINRESYYINSNVPATCTLNSTKTPYIPNVLYKQYGESNSKDQSLLRFRCCTPVEVSDNGKYNGFITYSMCQATGYKLKSNKELPSPVQVFSKIIPETEPGTSSDSPSGNQLYPMYSVLKFNDDCSELNVYMVRITGVFDVDGADTFNQSKYGKVGMTDQYLCSFEKEDCDYIAKTSTQKTGYTTLENVGKLIYYTVDNKVYEVVNETSTSADGTEKSEIKAQEYTLRMYGKWLDKETAQNRETEYLANPSTKSDNRYLHIIF